MTLTVPYVSTAEFTANPLVADLVLPTETELHEVLLAASRWCDDYVFESGTLTAHRHIEHRRTSPDQNNCLLWRPQHHPLIVLESLICNSTTYTAPLVSLRDERAVVVDLNSATTWVGSLQFGIAAELCTTWVYLAGYPNTLLGAEVHVEDTHLPVIDAIGILPGQTLRVETEIVIVDPHWVPTDGPEILPLAAPFQRSHTTAIVSALPEMIRKTVTLCGVALLTGSEFAEAQHCLDMHRWG